MSEQTKVTASNPEGHNQYTQAAGVAAIATAKANETGRPQDHLAAMKAHQDAQHAAYGVLSKVEQSDPRHATYAGHVDQHEAAAQEHKTAMYKAMPFRTKASDESATDAVRAGGPGSGRHAGASTMSKDAFKKSVAVSDAINANPPQTAAQHDTVANMHEGAFLSHYKAARAAGESGNKSLQELHQQMADSHLKLKQEHDSNATNMRKFSTTATAQPATASATVTASGTSDGAEAGHATRKTATADQLSAVAHGFSAKAHKSGEDVDHSEAVNANTDAARAHLDAAQAHLKIDNKDEAQYHLDCMVAHNAASTAHGAPQDTEAVTAAVAGLDKLFVKAGGPGSGRHAGSGEKTITEQKAKQASEKANISNDPMDHYKASVLNNRAAEQAELKMRFSDALNHRAAAAVHGENAWGNKDFHQGILTGKIKVPQSDEIEDHETLKARSTASTVVRAHDTVHCREVGSPLLKSAPWVQDQPVEFTYMPRGVHTINAGFRDGSINLTIECDPQRDASVCQASLDALRQEAPKQTPFGCYEHDEKEASVFAQEFKPGDEGIKIVATPSKSGAENVNGRNWRSWSPSFDTDAEYHKCMCRRCDSKVNACSCTAKGQKPQLYFPDGAKGSASNPARITGVDFVVGTLTNKPAFRAMPPVRARQQAEAAATVTAGGPGSGRHKGTDYTKFDNFKEQHLKMYPGASEKDVQDAHKNYVSKVGSQPQPSAQVAEHADSTQKWESTNHMSADDHAKQAATNEKLSTDLHSKGFHEQAMVNHGIAKFHQGRSEGMDHETAKSFGQAHVIDRSTTKASVASSVTASVPDPANGQIFEGDPAEHTAKADGLSAVAASVDDAATHSAAQAAHQVAAVAHKTAGNGGKAGYHFGKAAFHGKAAFKRTDQQTQDASALATDYDGIDAIMARITVVPDLDTVLARYGGGSTATALEQALGRLDGVKAHAADGDPDTTCPGCGHGFSYADETETSAGTVKCPACKAPVTQDAAAPATPPQDTPVDASNPEGHNQYTQNAYNNAKQDANDQSEKANDVVSHYHAAKAHMNAAKMAYENGDRSAGREHGDSASYHFGESKRLNGGVNYHGESKRLQTSSHDDLDAILARTTILASDNVDPGTGTQNTGDMAPLPAEQTNSTPPPAKPQGPAAGPCPTCGKPATKDSEGNVSCPEGHQFPKKPQSTVPPAPAAAPAAPAATPPPANPVSAREWQDIEDALGRVQILGVAQ